MKGDRSITLEQWKLIFKMTSPLVPGPHKYSIMHFSLSNLVVRWLFLLTAWSLWSDKRHSKFPLAPDYTWKPIHFQCCNVWISYFLLSAAICKLCRVLLSTLDLTPRTQKTETVNDGRVLNWLHSRLRASFHVLLLKIEARSYSSVRAWLHRR